MDEAEGPELTTESLTTRVLVVNFAAVHVSADMFALYWTLIPSVCALDVFQRMFESLVSLNPGLIHLISLSLWHSSTLRQILSTSNHYVRKWKASLKRTGGPRSQ